MQCIADLLCACALLALSHRESNRSNVSIRRFSPVLSKVRISQRFHKNCPRQLVCLSMPLPCTVLLYDCFSVCTAGLIIVTVYALFSLRCKAINLTDVFFMSFITNMQSTVFRRHSSC